MTEEYYDALTEISIAYLHEWIDSRYRQNFPVSSEDWLRRSGFYDGTCIIPHPPFDRWRRMMGMPPQRKVDRFFDENGNVIDHFC